MELIEEMEEVIEIPEEDILIYLDMASGDIYDGKWVDELTDKEKYVVYLSIIHRRKKDNIDDGIIKQLKSNLFKNVKFNR